MSVSESWIDPDEVPELDQSWFGKAALKVNGLLVKRERKPHNPEDGDLTNPPAAV